MAQKVTAMPKTFKKQLKKFTTFITECADKTVKHYKRPVKKKDTQNLGMMKHEKS